MKNFANFGAQLTASRHNQSIGIKLQLQVFFVKLRACKVQSKFDVAGWSKLQKPFWNPMKQKNYFSFGYSANSAQII